jgi:hypothetical protein
MFTSSDSLFILPCLYGIKFALIGINNKSGKPYNPFDFLAL